VDEERVNEDRGYAPAETTPKTTPKKNNLICELFGNGPYIFTVMGLSSLFFVFTGVQVWVTSYVVVVLGKSQAEITLAFGVTSITAPIIGVIAGGIFIDKIGGYKGEAAMALTLKICFAFACLAATFAITCAYVPKAVADQGVSLYHARLRRCHHPCGHGLPCVGGPARHAQRRIGLVDVLLPTVWVRFLAPRVCAHRRLGHV
jgi:hypothetical protein